MMSQLAPVATAELALSEAEGAFISPECKSGDDWQKIESRRDGTHLRPQQQFHAAR